MKLHENNFLKIEQLFEVYGIKIQWKSASEDMLEEDFRHEIEQEKAAIEKIKPRSILADTRQLGFSISPNLQEWHNKFLFPAFHEARVEKLAIIVSNDIFVQVSVEQLIEEEEEVYFNTRYFTDENQAIEWLKLKA